MGIVFKAPAFVIFAVGGLWGLWVCLSLIHELGGFILTAVALFLAPFILYLAPWYAGFFKGDWFPVLLVYRTTQIAFPDAATS